MEGRIPTYERRLLAVVAHPDDESFGMGGTLALYARNGCQAHLIVATQGEVGEAPPHLLEGHKDLAALRVEELRCAASILGLAGVEFLGYRDSGMAGSADNQHPNALAAADIEAVAVRVAGMMRRVRPQVVLTFDPIGGYGHPDHVAVHQATTRAFHLAGDRGCEIEGLPPYHPQKLYYHTFPRGFVKALLRLAPLLGMDPSRFGRNRDIDLRRIFDVDFPIHARISIGPAAQAKARASACHASQAGPPSSGLIGLIFRILGAHEEFMRGFPPANDGVRETDLYQGVLPDGEAGS